ncbi:MAG TPA: outer membrane beta-barrel protein [Planctomycetota bacterium]
MTWIAALALLAAPDDDLPRELGQDAGEKNFSFGFRLGVVEAPDADDATWTAAIALRWGLGPLFAVELSGAYYRTDFEDEDADVRVIPVQASLLLSPLQGRVRPFALAGVGLIFIDADFDGVLAPLGHETDTEFGAHLGLGLDLELGREAFLSGDARWNFYGDLEEDDLDFLQVTVGIYFRFS